MIVVSYAELELARVCSNLELAQRRLGPADAQSFLDLIADIEAMQNVAEVSEFYGSAPSGPDSLFV